MFLSELCVQHCDFYAVAEDSALMEFIDVKQLQLGNLAVFRDLQVVDCFSSDSLALSAIRCHGF